ncbi:MAG: hypothetical protein KC996_01210 [Phycisphaerales bacterium]|nr:hypothetical protein [Phycisphaerales bacterium]
MSSLTDQQRKERIWTRFRRITLVGTGVWCVGFGIAMIGVLIGSGTLGSTNTVALSMIVGVITLPTITLGAILMDRRVLRRVFQPQCADNTTFNERSVVAHSRHERGGRHGTHATKVPLGEPGTRVAQGS